jgi:hypothetical protein
VPDAHTRNKVPYKDAKLTKIDPGAFAISAFALDDFSFVLPLIDPSLPVYNFFLVNTLRPSGLANSEGIVSAANAEYRSLMSCGCLLA